MISARYVVDTDVVSETARDKPTPAVLAWLADQGVVALTSITVYELARGIDRLAPSRRRTFLETWFAQLLASGMEVLSFDREAALAAARIEGDARRRGRSIDAHDLFIIACAMSRGLSVATRNVAHFRGLGITVYDPFNDVFSV